MCSIEDYGRVFLFQFLYNCLSSMFHKRLQCFYFSFIFLQKKKKKERKYRGCCGCCIPLRLCLSIARYCDIAVIATALARTRSLEGTLSDIIMWTAAYWYVERCVWLMGLYSMFFLCRPDQAVFNGEDEDHLNSRDLSDEPWRRQVIANLAKHVLFSKGT